MIVKGAFGPKTIKQGCDVEFFIDFKRMVNPVEYVGTKYIMTYLYLVIHQNLQSNHIKRIRIAELYTASGQTHRFILADQPPGKYTYAIVVYGTGPEHILGGDPETSGLSTIELEIIKGGNTSLLHLQLHQ